MHKHNLTSWQHNHQFSVVHEYGERRTKYVFALTAIMMLVEIVAGLLSGSMALLADGWHMSTHAAAFAIALYAYAFARKHINDQRYSFGVGKVTVLGGFASAVALAVVAFYMVIESIGRLIEPEKIYFNEAIVVAIIGLIVNIVSAYLLRDDHHHSHTHQHDHTLRAAYFHVLADALTSVLAIVALLAGKFWGLLWVDTSMGIVGAIIIGKWSVGLIRDTGPILLDASADTSLVERIQQIIKQDADTEISDLHVWQVSAHHYAAIIAIVTHQAKSVEYYKNLLSGITELAHISVEINICDGK